MTRDDGYTRYTVRIPTPLYDRVKAAAGEASVNSLIVQVLEEKFPEPDDNTLVIEMDRAARALAYNSAQVRHLTQIIRDERREGITSQAHEDELDALMAESRALSSVLGKLSRLIHDEPNLPDAQMNNSW